MEYLIVAMLSGIIVHYYLVAFAMLRYDIDEEGDVIEVDPVICRMYAWFNVPIMIILEAFFAVDATINGTLTAWDYRSPSAFFQYFKTCYGPEWMASHCLPYIADEYEEDEQE